MKYSYKGTIITASTKNEAIQKILAEYSPYFSEIMRSFINNLTSNQRLLFKQQLRKISEELRIKTNYYYNSDDNGVNWMSMDLAYDDGGEGILYRADTRRFYYTFDAANRIAKKLGARLPTIKEWTDLALSKEGVINENNEDSGFKQRSDKSIIIDNIDNVKDFLKIKSYPGTLSNSRFLLKEGHFAVYWTCVPVGGGAVAEYISHKFMATKVEDKYAYLTVRLVK